MLVLGLTAGLVIGLAAGLLVARLRKRREMAVAPPEPSIGRYDAGAVGEESAGPEGPRPLEPAERAAPPEEPPLYKDIEDEGGYIPSVPAAEVVQHPAQAPPMPRLEGPETMWEEEGEFARPQGHAGTGERRVEELLRRLRR